MREKFFSSTEIFQSRSFSLEMKHDYLSGPDAKINVSYSGWGQDGTLHKANFSLNNSPVTTDEFTGYLMRFNDLNIPAADVKNQMELKI